jgi:hypothetical protein
MTFIICSMANVILKIDLSVVPATQEWVDLTRLKIISGLTLPFGDSDVWRKLKSNEVGLASLDVLERS